MDFRFSDDALMVQDMVRKFVEKEAKPLEMKYFTTGALEPKERARLNKVIAQMGLWGIMIPEEYGGGGLDAISSCLIEEELGKTFIPMEIGDIPPQLFACQGEQIDRYLNPVLEGKRRAILAVREPNAIHPADWCTRLQAISNDNACQGENQNDPSSVQSFVVNGEKILPSEPADSDFLVVFALGPHQEQSTSQLKTVKVMPDISAFFVEKDHPGVRIFTRVSKHTQDKRQAQVLLNLDGCKVDANSLLGEVGGALSVDSRLAHLAWLRAGARFVGLCERMIEMAAEYAATWVALGAPLINRPAVQHMLADAHVQVNCTRWLVYYAAWLADETQKSRQPFRQEAAEVRLAAGEMLRKVTDLITMVYGGPGSFFIRAGDQDSRQANGYASRSLLAYSTILELGLECTRLIIAQEILARIKHPL